MNNLSKNFVNEDGKEETVIANSTDNYSLHLNDHYSLANHHQKEESKFAKKFKKSIFGSDIGVKSEGFTSIAILSTVIVISVLLVLYFIWRF